MNIINEETNRMTKVDLRRRQEADIYSVEKRIEE